MMVWNSLQLQGFEIKYAGNISFLEDWFSKKTEEQDFESLIDRLRAFPGHFAFIAESDHLILAAVDKVRSYPVFYHASDMIVRGNALDIRRDFNSDFNKRALLELCAAGYVLGNETLYDDLCVLQAGEYLLFNKRDQERQIAHYYKYIPKPVRETSYEDAMDELGSIVDLAVCRTIDEANGRKIIVPLSGGLDSRIVAAKLREHKYDNVQLFSYGVKNNDEARIAREVAARLDLPWTMLPSSREKVVALARSQRRQELNDYFHGFSALPSYVEFEAIDNLVETGLGEPGDLIVNGQSGDYICGAHIPAKLFDMAKPEVPDIIEYIIYKHFSLWKTLKTDENVRKLTAHIHALLPPHEELEGLGSKDAILSAYESFEWTERQSKMVVHGQRIYEFYGFDWSLPLWDGDLMEFYARMPFDFKFQRKLFRDYVKQYNYGSVFDLPTAEINIWQPPLSWLIFGWANLLSVLYGKSVKQDFYLRMGWYGNLRNQLSFYERSLYNEHYRDIRNVCSLIGLEFCRTHKLPFPGSGVQ